nr:hypothetical protein [Bacillus sp. T33-2]
MNNSITKYILRKQKTVKSVHLESNALEKQQVKELLNDQLRMNY